MLVCAIEKSITSYIFLAGEPPLQTQNTTVSIILFNPKSGHFQWRFSISCVDSLFHISPRRSEFIIASDANIVKTSRSYIFNDNACGSTIIISIRRIYGLQYVPILHLNLFHRYVSRQLPCQHETCKRRTIEHGSRSSPADKLSYAKLLAPRRVVDDRHVAVIARIQFRVILHAGDLARLLRHALCDREDTEWLCLLRCLPKGIEIIDGDLCRLCERYNRAVNALHLVGVEHIGLAVTYHETVLLARRHRDRTVKRHHSTFDADHTPTAAPLRHIMLQEDHIADRAGDCVDKGIKCARPQLVFIGAEGVLAVRVRLLEVGAAHQLDLRRRGKRLARIVVVAEHGKHIALVILRSVHKRYLYDIRAPLCALKLLLEAVLLDVADGKELRRLRRIIVDAGEARPLHDDLAAPDRLGVAQRLPHLHRAVIDVVERVPLRRALLRPCIEHIVGEAFCGLAAHDIAAADLAALVQDVIARPCGIICTLFLIRFAVWVPDVDLRSLLHPCHRRIVAAQLLRCKRADADERFTGVDEIVIDNLRELRPIDTIDIAHRGVVLCRAAHTHRVLSWRQILKTVDTIDCLVRRLADAPAVVVINRRPCEGFHPRSAAPHQKSIRPCHIAERQPHPFRITPDDAALRLERYTRPAHAAAGIAVVESIRQRNGQLEPCALIPLNLVRRPSVRELIVELLIRIAVCKIRDDCLIVRAETDIDLHVLVVAGGVLVDADISDLLQLPLARAVKEMEILPRTVADDMT